MKKKLFVLSMALGWILALSGCGARTPVVVQAPELPTPIATQEPTVTAAEQKDFSASLFNDFAVRLFAASMEDGNVLQSPITQVLAMAQLRMGARAETAAEMDALLGLPTGLSEDALWSNFSALRNETAEIAPGQLNSGFDLVLGEGPSVHTRYISLLRQSLGSEMMMVDYGSAKSDASFNEWVARKTNGVLDEMTEIPSENTNTVTLAATVASLMWKRAFNTENVLNTTFKLENGQKLSAPMMTARCGAAITTDQGVFFACLPLDENMEAWLILPAEDSNSTSLVETLSAEQIIAWRERAETQNCIISLPKLNMTTTGSLYAAYQKMGMTYMNNAEQGDFGNMGDKITLSQCLYANHLTVDESGKEECDAAMTQRMLRGMDKTYTMYSFNRPFVLVMAQKSTRTIMLMARVANPTNKVVNIYQ